MILLQIIKARYIHPLVLVFGSTLASWNHQIFGKITPEVRGDGSMIGSAVVLPKFLFFKNFIYIYIYEDFL